MFDIFWSLFGPDGDLEGGVGRYGYGRCKYVASMDREGILQLRASLFLLGLKGL